MTDSNNFKTLGFIGLGAMGKPMLEHLANKLPKDSCLWVYDVVEQVVDEVCAAFPERVYKGTSAADVAQHTVRTNLTNQPSRLTESLGYHLDHGPRRLARTVRLS